MLSKLNWTFMKMINLIKIFHYGTNLRQPGETALILLSFLRPKDSITLRLMVMENAKLIFRI